MRRPTMLPHGLGAAVRSLFLRCLPGCTDGCFTFQIRRNFARSRRTSVERSNWRPVPWEAMLGKA